MNVKVVITKTKWLMTTVLICAVGILLGVSLYVKASQDKPAIKQIAASLYDELAFHYYASVPDGYTSPHMQFVLNGKTYTETEARKEGDYYIFTFDDIAPQYLESKVTAKLYAKRKGSEQQYDSLQKSMNTYCDELLGYTAEELDIIDEKYAAMKELIADLRTYCGQVKAAFGKQASMPYTFTLPNNVNVKDVVLKVTNSNTGEVYNIWDFEKVTQNSKQTTYCAYIDIAATECNTTFEMQLWVGNAAHGKSVKYSLQSYVSKNASSTTTDAKLAKSYYEYGLSAIKYGVNLSVDDIYDVEGASITLYASGGRKIERIFEQDHSLPLAGLAKGEYEAKIKVLGVEQSLGKIKIDDAKIEYPMDMAVAFSDTKSIMNGDISYHFASNTAFS